MIVGRARLIGDNIGGEQILNNVHLARGTAIKELVPYLFETCRPDLGPSLQKGDIIVAGENFGCGSSREHASLVLKEAGIPCVIAKSFARTFYRSGINLGILPIVCDIEAKELDTLEIDPVEGIILINHNRSQSFHKFPPLILSIIQEKGLLQYYKTHGTL